VHGSLPSNFSWFIGSITLLVVKGDEKTGKYRESLATLEHYSDMHQFDDPFRKKLRTQLRLEVSLSAFHHRYSHHTARVPLPF
jgi:hypothetical protein